MSDTRVAASAFVAPGAVLEGKVTVGERAVIMFGVVARAEDDTVSVGDETNLQDNVVVHCDAGFPTVIGARTTVGHGAVVHGATVGDGCLVGIGAIALNGSLLGEGAWLAAGSVLPEGHEVPPWTIAVGTPARPLRDITKAEIDRQRAGVENYLRLAERYRAREG